MIWEISQRLLILKFHSILNIVLKISCQIWNGLLGINHSISLHFLLHFQRNICLHNDDLSGGQWYIHNIGRIYTNGLNNSIECCKKNKWLNKIVFFLWFLNSFINSWFHFSHSPCNTLQTYNYSKESKRGGNIHR